MSETELATSVWNRQFATVDLVWHVVTRSVIVRSPILLCQSISPDVLCGHMKLEIRRYYGLFARMRQSTRQKYFSCWKIYKSRGWKKFLENLHRQYMGNNRHCVLVPLPFEEKKFRRVKLFRIFEGYIRCPNSKWVAIYGYPTTPKNPQCPLLQHLPKGLCIR